MNHATQSDMILAALKHGETLTAVEALQRFGCFRLAARIYDLRERWYRIGDRMVKVGRGKKVKEYRMEVTA